MALTPAQEQYLKGLGIGKGAGRGGAISGAGKGAAAGTMIMPGIGTAIGGIIGGIGGWLKGRGASKKAQAEARAKLEQANATFNRGEDTRLARLSAGQSLLQGLQGRGFTNIDPETAAKLSARRELDPAEAGLYNTSVGAGGEALGGVIDTAMGVAGQYAANRQGAPMSAGGGGGGSIETQQIVAPSSSIAGSGYQPFKPLQLDDFKPYGSESNPFYGG